MKGGVTGVRIDHVDGLYDPSSYLERLQKSCYLQLVWGQVRWRRFSRPSSNWWTCSPKNIDAGTRDRTILQTVLHRLRKDSPEGGALPEEWPVFGTTGYDFLNSLNGIFVETEKAKDFDRIYARFVKASVNFMDMVYEKSNSSCRSPCPGKETSSAIT